LGFETNIEGSIKGLGRFSNRVGLINRETVSDTREPYIKEKIKMTSTTEKLSLLENHILSKYGIKVVYSYKVKTDTYYPDKKLIEICPRQIAKHKLYSLLHEAGHILIQTPYAKYVRKFPLSHQTTLYGKDYRIDVLREEYFAWDKGFDLSKELKLDINEEKYYKYARKFLWGYIKWLMNPGKRYQWIT